MAKTPKAQYEKLIRVSSIKYETKLLLDHVDIPKALSHSPEPPGVWAGMAREAAANLLKLADKIAPGRETSKPSEGGFKFFTVTTEGAQHKVLAEPSNDTCSAVGVTRQRVAREFVSVIAMKPLGALSVEWIKQNCPEIVNLATDEEIAEIVNTKRAISITKWIQEKLEKNLGDNVTPSTIDKYMRRGKPKP